MLDTSRKTEIMKAANEIFCFRVMNHLTNLSTSLRELRANGHICDSDSVSARILVASPIGSSEITLDVTFGKRIDS